MIAEDFVSFKTAELLKAKGFDWEVHYNYRCFKQRHFFHRVAKNFNGSEYEGLSAQWYSAPTLQMAMKWLREVHNYVISICLDSYVEPYDNQYYILIRRRKDKYEELNPCEKVYFDTYEEAAEEAIRYCLENLI